MDFAESGRVGAMVALLADQPLLTFGKKGDGSFVWVKTQTSKGELYIGFVYGPNKRPCRVRLRKWMEANLNTGNWLICGDLNQTEKVRFCWPHPANARF